MNPPELRRYLRLVGTHLKDLGPLERRQILREVRADVLEFAMRGSPPTLAKAEISGAIGRMPDPPEVARTYLRRYPLSPVLARASFGTNAVLGIVSLILGAQILSMSLLVWQAWAVNLLISLASVVLVIAGATAVAIFGIALLAPSRASPWRFVVVPASVVCFTGDGFLVIAAAAALGLSWPLALSAFLATFLGGALTTSYAHRQLARAESRTHVAEPTDDYFSEVERHLGPLDSVRREGILRELRDHLASRGISSAEGGTALRRFEATQEVLGSPAEVASSYLRELQPDSSRGLRLSLKIALAIAGLGLVISVPTLGVGLQAPVLNAAYLTPLGLLGSVGLLGASLATLAVGMHLFRMPLKAPDFDFPLGALMVTCVLLISATAIAVPAGAVLQPAPSVVYDVKSGLPRDDGGLTIFWAAYSSEHQHPSFITFPDQDASSPALGAWVTELNPAGDLRRAVDFPWTLPNSPMLDLRVGDGTWTALFADSLYVWGERRDSVAFSPPPWQKADGRIGESHGRIAWVSHSDAQSVLNAHFTQIDVATLVEDAEWSRSLPVSSVNEFHVRVGPRSVLVAAVLQEVQEGYQRSAVSVYLLDEFGTASLATTLQEHNVTSAGVEDLANGTWLRLNELHAVEGGYWMTGRAGVMANRTTRDHTWAAWIDEAGTYSEWTGHEVETVSPSSPMQPGDRGVWSTVESIPQEGGLFVVTSTSGGVMDDSGDWIPDAETSRVHASSLRADGSIESATTLDSPRLTGLPLLPLLSIWEGTPMLFIFPMEAPDPDGRIPLYSYPAGNLSAQESPRSIPLSIGEAALFYKLTVQKRGERESAIGSGPNQAEFVGEAYIDNPGFLDWRKHVGNPALGYVQIPAVLHVDHSQATVRVIPLTTPATQPDTFLGITITTIFTVAAVLGLTIGYPRWRLHWTAADAGK